MSEIVDKQKRNRNVAHLWCDKQVSRYFRHLWKDKQLPTYQFQHLKLVYFALCEIESDFVEKRNAENKIELHALTKTIMTYTGLSVNVVSKTMQCLMIFGLIEYKQLRNGSRSRGTSLEMYEFDKDCLNSNCNKALSVLPQVRIMSGENSHRREQNKNDSKESSFNKKKTYMQKSSRTKPVSSKKQGLDLTPTSKEEIPFIEQFPKCYREHSTFPKIWNDFVENRIELKSKLTSRAVTIIVNKIRANVKTDVDFAIECINKAIMYSWKGVFFDRDTNKSFNSDKEHQLQLALHPSTTKAKSTKFAHLKPDVICNN